MQLVGNIDQRRFEFGFIIGPVGLIPEGHEIKLFPFAEVNLLESVEHGPGRIYPRGEVDRVVAESGHHPIHAEDIGDSMQGDIGGVVKRRFQILANGIAHRLGVVDGLQRLGEEVFEEGQNVGDTARLGEAVPVPFGLISKIGSSEPDRIEGGGYAVDTGFLSDSGRGCQEQYYRGLFQHRFLRFISVGRVPSLTKTDEKLDIRFFL